MNSNRDVVDAVEETVAAYTRLLYRYGSQHRETAPSVLKAEVRAVVIRMIAKDMPTLAKVYARQVGPISSFLVHPKEEGVQATQ